MSEKPAKANAYKAAREYMEKEAAQKLISVDCHEFALTAVRVVFPTESHSAIRNLCDSVIEDGDPVGVARQVPICLGRSSIHGSSSCGETFRLIHEVLARWDIACVITAPGNLKAQTACPGFTPDESISWRPQYRCGVPQQWLCRRWPCRSTQGLTSATRATPPFTRSFA
jgi:hypothetical protein